MLPPQVGNASGKNKRRARVAIPGKRSIQTRANCALCCPRANLRSPGCRNCRTRKLSSLQEDKRVTRQNCQTDGRLHLPWGLDNVRPLRVRSIKEVAARGSSSATRAHLFLVISSPESFRARDISYL